MPIAYAFFYFWMHIEDARTKRVTFHVRSYYVLLILQLKSELCSCSESESYFVDLDLIFAFVILGCTPLHWAAIKGNLEACTVLVQAGKKEDLVVTDNTGLTPAQLASDKNHKQVAFFLVGIPLYL